MTAPQLTPPAKFVFLFLATPASVAVFVAMSLRLGSWAGALSAPLMSGAVVAYAARNFRDPDVEALGPPRARWRMTARPTSGFVCAAVLLAQAAWVASTAVRQQDAWAIGAGVLTEALLGALSIRSSLRLMSQPGAAMAQSHPV